MVREVLTADRTYYVRSDAAFTDSPGRLDSVNGACKTWAQAVALVAALDLNGHTVTIQHGTQAGVITFAEAVTIPTMTGGGNLIISGSSTAGHTVVDSSSLVLPCFWLANTVTPVWFTNITLKGGGLGYGLIQSVDCSIANIRGGVVFDASVSAHIWVHDNAAKVYLLGISYSIIGSAAYHIFVNMGGAFLEGSTVTLTGTPAFSGAFVSAINGGAIQSPVSTVPPTTFTGSATGKRYDANAGGVINTFGGGASYFPGSIAGTATGGQYA